MEIKKQEVIKILEKSLVKDKNWIKCEKCEQETMVFSKDLMRYDCINCGEVLEV